MKHSDEEVIVRSSRGVHRGRFVVSDLDPLFVMALESDPWKIPIDKGDILVRINAKGDEEHRPIVGVSVAGAPLIAAGLEILAPRPVVPRDPDASFISYPVVGGGHLDLRPGTAIIGGRNSGFYDSDGLILEACHVGGDPERFEDWAFRVLGPSNFGELAPSWILLANVGFAVAAPASITGFKLDPSKTIDDLLAAAERELFEYFLAHPDRLETLSPKQLEQLIVAVYRNLGFSTEPIGAWNQADGGVDIVAVSKTDAGTDIRIAIQCKTSRQKISARPIRELAGVLEKFQAHQGVVVTTSRFTTEAKLEAEGSFWRVTLQDRDELFRRLAAALLPGLGI